MLILDDAAKTLLACKCRCHWPTFQPNSLRIQYVDDVREGCADESRPGLPVIMKPHRVSSRSLDSAHDELQFVRAHGCLCDACPAPAARTAVHFKSHEKKHEETAPGPCHVHHRLLHAPLRPVGGDGSIVGPSPIGLVDSARARPKLFHAA